MDDARKERLAKNEAMFRAINEVLRDPEDGQLEVTCECGDATCETILRLPVRAYEQVRADPCRFVIAPGHAMPEVEDVVERTEGYEVVHKQEEAAAIVEETDPRQ